MGGSANATSAVTLPETVHAKDIRYLVGGTWRTGEPRPVHFPYTGEAVAHVHYASPDEVRKAVANAHEAFLAYQNTPAHVRYEVIMKAAEKLEARGEEVARLMTFHAGKHIKEARGEVGRSLVTLRVSAEEAKRLTGEVLALDAVPSGEGVFGFTMRLPLGVIAGISPFNAPLNLACHKVGPALAAGNAIVLKPHPAAAGVSNLLAEAFAEALVEAGLPPGVFNVVHGDAEAGEALVTHPKVRLVSFTGSGRVAETILKQAGLKPTVLELGGNAPTLIHRDANLENAAQQCVKASFGLTGQSCVSTQRLYVHEEVFEDFSERFVALAKALKAGDPREKGTDIGPLVNEATAERVERWIQEAVDAGATLRCGGKREGSVVEPTVLSGVTSAMRVVCEEVFGPIVSLIPYRDIEEAIGAANNSPWGLKAGIFTESLDVMLLAARRLEVGTLNVNAPSRSRTDIEPSGGIKESGWGKEGPRYAVESMTQLKMVSVRKSRVQVSSG